ncbi:MFS transporter [Rhodotorula paludigena]|uniref:MFS transporter n=1 Tax=Rhodotorula paludigena TaxID=86838 RepID=UPI003181C080
MSAGYTSGRPLDHTDSYALRGEDDLHHPDSALPSRAPSPAPRAPLGDDDQRTLASGGGGSGHRDVPAGESGDRRVSDVEKGLKHGQEGVKRDKSRDPETREWKDDVVTFDSKDDPANPKNWTMRRRYLLVALLGFTTMSSTFASSIFSTATAAVSQEFGISTEVATLGTSLFLCGFIPGPVIFGPLSEMYGRKTIFIGTFIFICFSAGTATAKDVQTIMLTRFFGGMGASAAPSVVGGALADMFDTRERATAVVFYSLAIVAGPTVAPVIGSAVTYSYLGWRWTEYLVVIISSAVGLVSVLLVPETFAAVILTRKAQRLRLRTKRWALHSKHEENDFSPRHFVEKTVTRPLQMLVKEPMVLCICIYNSFAYGCLYLMFSAVPIIFEEGRGWTPVQTSTTFLAVLVGTLIAASFNYLYGRFYFAAYMDKHDGHSTPEMRLGPMMVGGVTFPLGFFLLGWASVAGKIIGLVFIGMSFLLIFQAGINYLLDMMTVNAASAVAANTFLRSIFAAALPLVAMPLYHNLGPGRACSILGGIAGGLGTVPFLFYVYGPRLRAMSRFAKSD